jgi:hypothetical protein
MRGLLLTALLLSSAAGASELEDAQDNLETVARNYVAQKSTGDYWVFRRAHGKTLKLTFTKIERVTVHRAGGGLWRGVADFRDAKTKQAYYAEVTADFSSSSWEVKKLRWLTKRELADARVPEDDDSPAASSTAASAPAKAARVPGPQGLLPEVTLTSVSGGDTFLPDCPKAKCLTVVVAPWCPHCRNSTDVLKSLQDYLPAHDVGMRVIVTADTEENVRDYAETFGPNALMDVEKSFRVPGFPCYIVSTAGGGIISQGGRAPESEKDPARFASALGLP